MKKRYLKILFLFLIVFVTEVKAITYTDADIEDYSIVIGTHLFTEESEPLSGWDGRMNTSYAMLGASSITTSGNVKDMLIYYKYEDGDWVNYLTDESVDFPATINITHKNGVCIDASCSGESINVTLNYNNVLDADTVKFVAYGSVFNEPEVPTRLGHKFVCWEISSGNCYDFTKEVTEDITLSAKWEAYIYKVTFVNTVNNQTYEYSCDFTSADQCSYKEFTDIFGGVPAGYTSFMGWSLAETGEKVYSSSSNFTDLFNDDTEFTLYSIFNSGTTSVSYNLDGGTFISVVSPVTSYEPTDLIHTITSPFKEGYTFAGWEVYSGDATIDDDVLTINTVGPIVLKALWKVHTYQLVYDSKTIADCTYGTYCTIDKSLINVPEGKELTKLEVEIDTDKYIEIGTSVKNLTDVDEAKLNVKATIEDITYNVHYDYNGGSVSNSNDTKIKVDTEITLNRPTKIGYTFKEWSVSNGAIINGDTLILNSPMDIKVDVIWEANSYVLSYDGKDYVTCTYDVPCQIPELDENSIGEGNTFNGWYIKEGDTRVDVGTTVTNIVTSGSVILYADIQPIEYNIVYEYNGGILSDINVNELEVGGTTKLNIPTKEGYTFKNWEVSDGATIIDNVLKLEQAKEITVKAVFEANTYTLKYNGDTYADCIYDQVCTVNGMSDNDVPTGKEFLRWVDSENNIIGSTVYNYVTSGDVEISPVYTSVEYTITYNYDGGNIVSSNALTYTIDNLTIPLYDSIKKGYNFEGWSVTSGSASIENDTLIIESVGDILLTAIWNANTYNLVYSDSEIEHQECIYDSTCTISDVVPSKDGYIFNGWIYGTYLFNPGDTINLDVTGDVLLEANWVEEKADIYSINYVLNGGTFENSPVVSFTENIGVDSLSIPIRYGYTFDGWYSNKELTGDKVTGIAYNENKDVTLYAKWIAKTYDIVLYADEAGANVLKTINCTYGENCELGYNSSLFEGYTLLGWAKNIGGNVFYGDNLVVSNITDGGTFYLYPVLEIDSYVIMYYLDGGSFVNEDNVSYTYNRGDAVTLPEVTKVGYTLKGWMLSDGTAITDGQTNINKDIVLIPVWEIQTYSIKYVDEDGNDLTIDSDIYPTSYTFDTKSIIIPGGYNLPEGIVGWKVNDTDLSYYMVDGIKTTSYILDTLDNKDITIVGYDRTLEITYEILDEQDLMTDTDEADILSLFESDNVLYENEASKSLQWDYSWFPVIQVLINGEEVEISSSSETGDYITIYHENYEDVSNLIVTFILGEKSGV